MGSFLVVVSPPCLEARLWRARASGTASRSAFVAQAGVESLDEAVLLRLAWSDVMPADAGLVRPVLDGVRGQFGAVVADDGDRAVAQADEGVQFPRSRERGVRNHGHALARAVVDTARMRKRRPSVIWSETKSWLQCWPSSSGAASIGFRVPIARLRPAHRQQLIAIEPLHPVPIHGMALAPQPLAQPAIAESPALLRQLLQPLAQRAVVRVSRCPRVAHKAI